MMTEQEAKEFMAKPLPERFHDFMLMEMCDEDGFNEMMRNKPSVRDFSKRMRYLSIFAEKDDCAALFGLLCLSTMYKN